MYDTREAATYRSFELNDAALSGGSLVGCRLESFDSLPINGVGYVEKAARRDGMDAVDVYLGVARFRLTGTIYGSSRGDTYDRLDAFRAAFNPTNAYDDDSANSGFLPLYYSRPTDRTTDYPGGSIDLYINVRPISVPQITVVDDRTGGYDSTAGFAYRWVVDVEAKDPRSYVVTEKTIDLSGATSGSGTFANKGTYPAPLTFLLYADTNDATIFHFIGGGADITLEIPALTDGPCLLTLDPLSQVALLTYGGQQLLRMDLFTSSGEAPFPTAPAGGGGSFSWTTTNSVQLLENSVISYHEVYV